jgi:hypothetical protein
MITMSVRTSLNGGRKIELRHAELVNRKDLLLRPADGTRDILVKDLGGIRRINVLQNLNCCIEEDLRYYPAEYVYQ